MYVCSDIITVIISILKKVISKFSFQKTEQINQQITTKNSFNRKQTHQELNNIVIMITNQGTST